MTKKQPRGKRAKPVKKAEPVMVVVGADGQHMTNGFFFHEAAEAVKAKRWWTKNDEKGRGPFRIAWLVEEHFQ